MAGPADPADRAVRGRQQLRHHRAPHRASSWASGSASRCVVDNRVGGIDHHRHRCGRQGRAGRLHARPCQHHDPRRERRADANLPFDPVKDFAPVAMIGISPFVLISSPHTPAATLEGLRRARQGKPGTLSYASAGTGTLAHLAGELFKSQGRHRCHPRALSRQRAVDVRPDAGPHRPFGRHHPADACSTSARASCARSPP